MDEPFKLPEAQQKKSWLLWGVLLFSTFTYLLVAMTVQLEFPKDAVAKNMVQLYAFAGVAAAIVFVLFFVLPKVLIRKSAPEDMPQKYFVYSIVRWAMSEAVCIVGLMYFFMSGSRPIFFGFLGCSILLFLINAPTARDQESYGRAAS